MTELAETPTAPPRKGLRAYVPSQNFEVREAEGAAQRQAGAFASVRISSMFSENHKVQMQDFLRKKLLNSDDDQGVHVDRREVETVGANMGLDPDEAARLGFVAPFVVSSGKKRGVYAYEVPNAGPRLLLSLVCVDRPRKYTGPLLLSAIHSA